MSPRIGVDGNIRVELVRSAPGTGDEWAYPDEKGPTRDDAIRTDDVESMGNVEIKRI